MKVLVIFLSIALVFVNGDSSSEEFDLKELKELDSLLKEKFNISIVGDLINLVDKVESKCPDLESKLESVGSEIETCLEEIELGSDTFCNIIKKNYVKCTKPARELIINCLPEKSKDLPLLGEKLVVAVIDQACNSTVEEVLELFNPCALEKDIDEVPSCEEVVSVVQKHKNELPSKELICDMLPKVKKCVTDQQSATCKNPVTKAAHRNFFEAVEDAIKNECDSLNQA